MRATESGLSGGEMNKQDQERLFRLALLQSALAGIRASQRSSWDWQLRSAAEAFVGRPAISNRTSSSQ